MYNSHPHSPSHNFSQSILTVYSLARQHFAARTKTLGLQSTILTAAPPYATNVSIKSISAERNKESFVLFGAIALKCRSGRHRYAATALSFPLRRTWIGNGLKTEWLPGHREPRNARAVITRFRSLALCGGAAECVRMSALMTVIIPFGHLGRVCKKKDTRVKIIRF